EHGHRAPASLGRACQLVDRALVPHVGRAPHDFRATRDEGLRDRLQFRLAARAQCDARTAARERFRERPPQPVGRARDQHDFSAHILLFGHRRLPPDSKGHALPRRPPTRLVRVLHRGTGLPLRARGRHGFAALRKTVASASPRSPQCKIFTHLRPTACTAIALRHCVFGGEPRVEVDRMSRITALAVATLFTLGACSSAGIEPGPTVQPAPLRSANLVPSGTVFSVRLNETRSTNRSEVGERFAATVITPRVTADGRTVVPRGSVVSGVVTGVDPSTRPGDIAAIRVNFDRLQIGNRSYPFTADVIDTEPRLTSDESRILERAGIGAAAGAVLGAIVTGGDLEGILVGGALGAGAGTIISLGLGDVDPELDEGSVLTLRTTRNVQLR